MTMTFDRVRDLFVAPRAEPSPALRAAAAPSFVAPRAERAAASPARGLAGLFVRPATVARPAETSTREALATAVAVLCAPGDASLAGTVVALAAAARAGAPCALVCRWTGGASAAETSALAVPAARRLAERLRGRGLDAVGAGRIVTLALPADAGEAASAAGRAAAVTDAPQILVVAGPRPGAFDDLLASQDRIIVVSPREAPDGLEALALADAARVGHATGVLRLPASAANRAVAGTGLLLPRALRAAATAALDGAT